MDSQDIYSELVHRFPYFESYQVGGEELHTIFSFFASDIIAALKEPTDDVGRYLEFLNEMAESKDEKILDVLGTTVFISIYDQFPDPSPYQALFSERALRLFKENIDRWAHGNKAWEDRNREPQ